MKTSSTSTSNNGGVNFKFCTSYRGHKIALRVVSNNNLFSVLHDNKPIGNIKLGTICNTWYVVDKSYIPSYLIDAVANRISAHLLG